MTSQGVQRLLPDMQESQLAASLRAAAAHFEDSPRPSVGLVLGSGLGGIADEIEDGHVVGYEVIPHMPASRVAGHAGKFVLGRLEGTPVAAMQGRVHLYEGHGPGEVVFGVRLMCALGAETVLVTNAAGGIDPGFEPGTLMLIEDHLNLTGDNPLVGPNDDALGPRFPDMTQAYDRGLLEVAERVASDLGFEVPRGVYAGLLGPTYETPAEVRMLGRLGASAVGMSTVLEVIAARHLGARVLGISCITNPAAGLSDGALTHGEVQETARRARERFTKLVRGVLRALA